MRDLLLMLASLLAPASTQGILYLGSNSACTPIGSIERVCKRLDDCPEVNKSIQRRSFAQICSFEKTHPVVCCPILKPPSSHAVTSSPSTERTPRYQDIGQPCQQGFERGYCRKDRDCPGAISAIREGWRPNICSFRGKDNIICCPVSFTGRTTMPVTPPNWPQWTRPSASNSWTQSSSNNWEPATQRPSSVNAWPSWSRPSNTKPPKTEEPYVWGGGGWNTATSKPNPPSKADIMCKKYAKYVYKNVTSPTLSLFEDVYEEAFCGSVATPLIVKGVDAAVREFPHMVRIGYGNPPNIEWLCGGSLISERWILSAAHCTQPSNRVAGWANLGDLDTSTETDDAQPITIKIIERINHPSYKSSKSLYHDLALYKLQRDAPLGIYIRPLCLNTKPVPSNIKAIASGWGHTFFGSRNGGSAMLQKVELNLVPPEKCNVSYRAHIPNELPNGIHPDYMLCAGGHDGKDTCQGDSGGPLQIALKEPYCMYSIIGITSFGKGCGSTTPGVYTNVANYVPWIEKFVWPREH